MTAKFQYDLSDLDALRPHATPRELEAIDEVQRLGSAPAAAAALGVSVTAVHQRLGTLRRRARRAGLGAAAPPAGWTPVAVSSDGQGRVRAVRSVPEPTAEHLPPTPEGHEVKGVSTLLDASGEVRAQWVKTDRAKAEAYAALRSAVEAIAGEYVRPVLPTKAPSAVDLDLATILPWGDPHFGLLAWGAETGGVSWDLKLAEEASAQVFADLISRTPRSGVFVLSDLGDLFHADDDRQVTPTAAHKLDVDSRAGKIARVAVRIFRHAIDLALQRHARVSVRLLRGNHDPQKALMLGLILEGWYAAEPRVTIEPFEDVYQYWQHGDCAFMWHHGDGSKPQNMPGIFACHPSWGPAKHRYIQTGHIHSQNRWDLPGCTVESFRTIAAPDQWSHWKGYRSGRTLDAITYHRELGEISRVQQGLVTAKRALKGRGGEKKCRKRK